MTEIVVKILVELLSTLAFATQQVKQGRLKKIGMKLLGERETEAVLQRLDRLNHEEARTTAAETLGVVYELVKNMKMVMDGGRTTSEDIRRALVAMQQIASNMNKFQPAIQVPKLAFSCGSVDQLQHCVRHPPRRNCDVVYSRHHFPQMGSDRFAVMDPRKTWARERGVLSSSIIRKVTRLCDAGLASMAYFYFDFKDTTKQDARAALSYLLIQLSYQSDPRSDILDRLYSVHRSGGMQPSGDTLMKCLREMLTLPRNGPTYIILDALDECPKSEGTPSPRESVLELVRWLTELGYPNLHVCVTSRPEANIKANLQPLASHSVSLHDESGKWEDINDYIVSFTKTDIYMRKWKARGKGARYRKTYSGC
ncbi:hypothetical protein EDB87DRAFT_1213135 [Lactarius vividus]|nr:hypothetical protein EDB87DRAFT_1213135 [Lactarius vividus]